MEEWKLLCNSGLGFRVWVFDHFFIHAANWSYDVA